MKLTCAVLLIIGMVFPSAALAANENPTVDVTIGGKLYKEAFRPAKMDVAVELHPGPSDKTVTPYQRLVIDFPKDMRFDPSATRPCPDSRISNITNTATGLEYVSSLCPWAVVGNGRADVYLARINNGAPNLTDPELVAFNAGRAANGGAKIKIVGYSRNTNAGLYMSGVFRNGRLTVDVPTLSYDSTVGKFELSFPGSDNPSPYLRGKSTRFVQARCSNGVLKSNAKVLFGTRNPSTGIPFGPQYWLSTPESTQICQGMKGKARNQVALKVARRVKAGKPVAVTVKITNSGTASSARQRVTVSGRGFTRKLSFPALKPGSSQSRKVKVRFQKGKSAVKAKAPGASRMISVFAR